MKKCMVCGEVAMKSKRETHKFDALPGVILENIEVRHCGNCGEREIVIPRMEQLVRAIALVLISEQRKLTGREVRFLRKSLGWSGADFAKHIGVGQDTVSKWENDKEQIGPQSDRLLRMMVVHGVKIDDYSLDSLIGIDKKPKELKLRFKANADGWHAAAS